jgi:polyhydroxybutyrate depolymerase
MVSKLIPVWSGMLICVLDSIAMAEGQVIEKAIDHDGDQRTYALYVPDSYDGTEPWPLVINIHGATSTAFEQMEVTGMNDVADANHFLVVYPQANGDPPRWRDDDLNGRGGNDIQFMVSMIDALENDYSIDSAKIYATGLSQGGAMSHALATEFSDHIAAIASVSGHGIFKQTAARPLPLMLMHGTADPIVPTDGATVPETGITHPPNRDVVEAWRNANQCQANPLATEIPNTNLDDESSVTRFDYLSCAAYVTRSGETVASEVVFFEIENGGHAWSGGPDHGFGNLNRDIHATEVIWEFFSRHELPLSPTGDFNGSGVLDVTDIDQLGTEIHRESQRRVFDVNQDGMVTSDDYARWVVDLRQTWIGDADLNGEFNSGDLIEVFSAGLYEKEQPAGWATGDWDGNGAFESGDLIAAFADGGYEQGPRPALRVVPEPSSVVALLAGGILLLRVVRRNRRSETS